MHEVQELRDLLHFVNNDPAHALGLVAAFYKFLRPERKVLNLSRVQQVDKQRFLFGEKIFDKSRFSCASWSKQEKTV
jgi:hypothetical protein